MSEASRVSIPVPRPELLEPWPDDSETGRRDTGRRDTGRRDTGRRDTDTGPAASRSEAVLRRVRKRAKLIRRRSMPLLGGMLMVALAGA